MRTSKDPNLHFKQQLRSVHSVDIQDSNQYVTILTNENQLKNFIIGEKEIKILLFTDHESPQGVFVKFYEMAKPLKILGCQLAVTVQEISPSFQLIIKINGIEHKYDVKEDIPYIISIIAATVDVGFENERLFHSLNAEALNTKLPFETHEDLKDLNNLILNSRLKNSKGLTITKSKQETFEHLTRIDERLKIFMPIDVVRTSYQAIRNIPLLLATIPSENIDWIVGNLNINVEEEAGFLYIIRNMKVLAVCLDDFDLALLRENFDEENLNTLLVLSPLEMNYSFYPKRVQTSLNIIKMIESYDYKLINISSFGIASFDEPINEDVTHALQLVSSIDSKSTIKFIGTLSKFALKDHKELKNCLTGAGFSSNDSQFDCEVLTPETKELVKQGVIDILQSSNPLIAKIEMTLSILNQYVNDQEKQDEYAITVNAALNSLISDETCPPSLIARIQIFDGIELKVKCVKIIKLLEKFEDNIGDKANFNLTSLLSILNNETRSNINNVILSYLNQINLDENIFGKVKPKLIDELKKKHVFQLISYLTKISNGTKYFIVQKGLEDICCCSEKDKVFTLDRLLTKLSDKNVFGDEQWEGMWNNNRFLLLINSHLHHNRIAEKLILLGCENLTPNYVPKEIAVKINATRIIRSEIVLPETIDDIDHFHEVLKEIRRNGAVPEKLKTILAKSICIHEPLRDNMETFSILENWRWNGNCFEEVIEMSSIESIVDKINAWKQEIDSAKELEFWNDMQFTIDFFDKEQPPIKLTSDDPEDFVLPTHLLNVFGDQPNQLSSEFLHLNLIIKKPQIKLNANPIYPQVMPYLIQKIKMLGCFALTEDGISSLITDYSNPNKSKSISNRPKFRKSETINSENHGENKNLISRLDTVTALFNNVNSIVGQNLLKLMLEFYLSIPLIIKSIYKKEKFQILVPWLTQKTIKWQSNFEKIIENNLFTDKFKMIVVLRIGDVKEGNCGKSTFLNQLFSKENVFSSFGTRGAKNKKPLTLNGTVEMVCLTQQISNNSLWESCLKEHYQSGKNEVILLVNLHGNALELPDHLNFLKSMASAFLMFVMPEGIEEMASDFEKIEEMLSLEPGSDTLSYIAVDPIEEEVHEEELIIETSKIQDDSNNTKLINVLRTVIEKCGKEFFDTRQFINIGSLEIAEPIETELSNNLIDYVQKNSCQKVKNVICLQRVRGNNILLECSKIWKNNRPLSQLITIMGNILNMDIDMREKAFLHLENKLDIISSIESSEVRRKYRVAQNELLKKIETNSDDQITLNQWRVKINYYLEQMDNISLGLEDLFSEIGKFFELSILKNPENDQCSLFARSYAELLIAGQGIELFDGESNTIPITWISAIFQNVSIIYPELKIFVISILGLQSSGKSTLLNAMFASGFATKIERCTRGIFMKLLFLDKEMKEKLGLDFDAIVLLDTEGLAAPEKEKEEESQRKYRITATFVMGISHLTIVNVFGEQITNLVEILQIAIVSIVKVENVEISPNILMVQQLKENKNKKMTLSLIMKLQDALDNAIVMTQKNDINLGIRNPNCLDKLRMTIEKGMLFRQVRPLKNTPSLFSPPSEEFHEDIVELYKFLVETVKLIGTSYDFNSWSQMIFTFWNSIKNENLMRFKDVNALQEYLDTTEEIFKVQETIETAFKEHSEAIIPFAIESADKISKGEMKNNEAVEYLKNTFKRIPSNCPFQPSCDNCNGFLNIQGDFFSKIKGKSNEEEASSTIQGYINIIKDDYIKLLSQIISANVFRQFESKENISKFEKIDFTDIGQDWINIRSMLYNVWNEIERDGSEKVLKSPLMIQIEKEICLVYRESPKLLDEIRSEKINSLENIPAIKLSPSEKTSNAFTKTSEFLLPAKTYELEGALKCIPEIILKNENVSTFRRGMIKKMSVIVDNIIKKLIREENHELQNEFKWKVTKFAILNFISYMKEKEVEWSKHYNPLVVFQNNKKKYLKWISLHLKLDLPLGFFDLDFD